MQRLGLLAIWTILLVGCQVDLAVRGDAQIRCSNETECPKGYRCTADGLCISERNAAPTVSFAAVAPPGASLAQRYVQDAVITVTLVDLDSDRASLALEVSSDYDPATGDGNWTAIDLGGAATDLAASEAGTVHELGWDTSSLGTVNVDLNGDGLLDATELVTRPLERVYLRGRATDSHGASGPLQFSNPFALGNEPPALTNAEVPQSDGGEVVITFVLSDLSSHLAAVDLEFRTNSAGPWRKAAIGAGRTTDMATSPTGLDYVITWDSTVEPSANAGDPQGIGLTTEATVDLRLRASDEPFPGTTHGSAWQEFLGRAISNQSPPRLETLFVDGDLPSASGAVTIVYRLSDDQSDPVDVLFEHSTDSGTSWAPCAEHHGYASEGVVDLASAPGDNGGIVHLFQWDVTADTLTHVPSAQVRARITDGRAEAGPFVVAPVLAVGPPPDVVPYLPKINTEETATWTSEPVAAVVADFDGDQVLDVAMADRGFGGATWVRGAGDGTFGSWTTLGDMATPRDILAAELDATEGPDIVIAGEASDGSNVHVLHGASEERYILPWSPFDVAVGDVDGDGTPDLISTPRSYASEVYVLSGQGDGTFVPAADMSPLSAPGATRGVTVADVDGDGEMDLVAGSRGFGFFVAFGNGSGLDGPVAIGSESLVQPRVVDLDLDGIADVVGLAGQYDRDDLVAYPGVGNRAFGEPALQRTGKTPRGFDVGDLDADGRADVVVANDDSTDGVVLLNRSLPGVLAFAAPFSFRAEQGPVDAVIADVDANGALDFIIVNELRVGFSTFLAAPAVAASPLGEPSEIPAGTFAFATAVADSNADGRPDLLVGSQGETELTVLSSRAGAELATGLFGSSSVAAAWGTRDIVAADFDGDGAMDVAMATTSAELTFVQGTRDGNGLPDGGFNAPTSTPTATRALGIDAADYDGNGVLDVVLAHDGTYPDYAEAGYELLLGSVDAEGAVSFASSVSVNVYPTYQPRDIIARDFDLDGAPDLAFASWEGGGPSSSQGFLSIRRGDGDGGLVGCRDITLGAPAQSIAAADLNRDGLLDLAIAHSIGVEILLGNTDLCGVGFTSAFTCVLPSASNPTGVDLPDLNGDGVTDVVIGYDLTRPIALYLGLGDIGGSCATSFAGPFDVMDTWSYAGLGHADVDLDGASDLVFASPLSASLLRLNGRPMQPRTTWQVPVTPFGASTQPTDIHLLGLPLGRGITQRPVLGVEPVAHATAADPDPAASFADALRQAGVLSAGYRPATGVWAVAGDRHLKRVPDPTQPDAPAATRLRVIERFGPVVDASLGHRQRAGLDLGDVDGRGVVVSLPWLDAVAEGDLANATGVLIAVRQPEWLRADAACTMTPASTDPLCGHPDAGDYLPLGEAGNDVVVRTDVIQVIDVDAGTDFGTGTTPRFIIDADNRRQIRLLTDRLGVMQAFYLP